MKIYSRTRKSHCWNEDRFINGKDFCLIIDGATPLRQIENFNGARWLVAYIKKNLPKLSGGVKDRLTLLCRDAYINLPQPQKDKEYLPSASACWVEFCKNKMKVGILGDCEVTAKLKKGEIRRYYDGRLSVLDKKAIDEMISLAKEKNIHICEARNLIQGTLLNHRNLVNEPHGYSALIPSPDGEIKEISFEAEIGDLETVYLYSDGFSQAFEHLQIYSGHVKMFENIVSIDEEIEKIVKASYGDRTLDLHPRFKIIDDITATEISF